MNRRTEISTLNNKNAYQVPGNCGKLRVVRFGKLREIGGNRGKRETGNCGNLRETGICGKQEIAGCEKREIAGILWE